MTDNPDERLRAQVMALEFLVSRLMARSIAAATSQSSEATLRVRDDLTALIADSRSMIRADLPDADRLRDLIEKQTRRLVNLAVNASKS